MKAEFLCAALLAFAVGAAGLPESERLQFADGLYARAMYDLAVEEYLGFLDDHPQSASADVAYFRLGECYRRLKRTKDAEQAYRTVFVKYPHSDYRLKAGYKRADLFMERQQYEAAIDLFGVVLKEKPPPEIASACLYFTAEALVNTKRSDEAVPILEGIVSDYPEERFCSYALLKLGGIHATTKNDHDKGLSFFTQAAAKATTDRTRAEALFQIAELHFRRKAYEQSAQHYRKLLTEYPDDQRSIEAGIQASWAAHYAGLYTEALTRAVKALDPGTEGSSTGGGSEREEWLYLKANCERQLMKNENAVATYIRLIDEHPGSRFIGAARYEKALTFYRMGLLRKAVDEAGDLELEGELRKDVYWLLAESYSALKEEERAIQFYRLLARHYPDSDAACDATYRLAHHLKTKGDNKEAARHYHLVAEKFPARELAPQALFAAAMCMLQDDLQAEAARDWSNLIERYPKSPLVEKAMYQKAMCEIRLGRDTAALASLRVLLKRFPATSFTADARYWEGMLLMQEEQLADASEAFGAALGASPRKELARDAEFYLGVVLHESGKVDEAVERFLPLLSSPDRSKFTPQLLVWLAEHLSESERYEESIKAAGVLLELNGEPQWQQMGWGLAGRSHAAKGDKDRAREAFTKCLEAKAHTRFAGESALRLGEFALETGAVSNAAKYFTQAASLASDESLLGVRARAYAGLARTAKADGDIETATRYFMTVAILYDDAELVPVCLYEAAQAFTELEQPESAQKALDELLSRYPDSPQSRSVGSADTNE